MQRRERASDGTGLDFVISDGSLDRHGTRINPDGWDLAAFKRNPIALFGHSGGFPIGRWEDVRAEGGKLLGRLVLAAKGTSARIDELASLVEQGILRAVSVGFSVLKYGTPGKSEYDYEQQELLEVSLVSVPSNTNALAAARGLNISPETLSLAFGEHAEKGRGRATAGEHADPNTERTRSGLAPLPKGKSTMSTLSQRIEAAQADLNTKRDRLTEISGAETLDVEALEALNVEVETAERALNALKATEQRIGLGAGGELQKPNLQRRPLSVGQRELSGLDLMVRATVANGIAMFTGRALEKVLEERYPGQEAVSVMARADATIGTTTVSGWAAELMQTSYAAFVDALRGKSIYPELRGAGMALSFDQAGTAYIPSLTAGGANGSFFGEGSPMRVGRITTAATTMTPRKMGVIVPFSREAAKRSTPSLEALVRDAIVKDTAAILDSVLLDAVAGDSIRPAGLLNGVPATASGFGGGDYQAVIEDINALLAPFDAANASDGIILVMHPAQARKLAMLPGPDGTFGWSDKFMSEFKVVRSTHATAGRLIALRGSDFITAAGDAPQFEMSNSAVVHMEDSAPAEIVSGTGPTTADPVRSFWQTDTVGVRMVMDVSWKMRRAGMVRWIDGTTW